jgi:hypothetical protein
VQENAVSDVSTDVVVTSAELVAVERVRCLDCGTSYLKPCGGTITRRNPGCPRCGYVGWISALVPAGEEPEGRQQHTSGPRRLQLHRSR